MMTRPHLPSLLALGALLLMSLASTICPAQPVSREAARQAAKTFLANNGISTAELADVSAAAGLEHLYVFTTSHSFVLMAADSRVQPVLGYSLNGGFDTEGMPENKKAWIQEYSDGIQYAIEHQTRASAETSRQWRALLDADPDAGRSTVVVGPLIQTQWDQYAPYNLFCPSGTVTGCVATAMAQVMKYWNYPEHGIGSHSYVHSTYGEQSADFGSTYYDWSNMTNTYNSSSAQAEKTAVATLMYHCGVSVDMNYGPASSGGSGAVTAHVADALKSYFNYSSDVRHLDRSAYTEDSVWIALLKAELDQRRPMQYHGRSSGGGHSFVCDGYRDDDFFHFNWGWSGSCDEYYAINNLNPGPGGAGSGAYGIYNDNQGVIVGIHPSECVAKEPSGLTYALSGVQNLTLNWTVADGAVGYNIYCNNNFVGSSSTTTYSEAAPFGTNVYYVRSVDANGALSLSSNTVTVTVAYQIPVVTDLAATANGNNVNLSWTAPEWCYPETPTATVTYGNGSVYYTWSVTYYGHRYLASDMAQYANKAVYKISTYVLYPGTYSLYVYTQTSGGQPNPASLAASKTDIPVTSSNSWYEIILDAPVLLTGTEDLWVVMKQADTGQDYPTPSFNLSSYDANACYVGDSPTNLNSVDTNYPVSWFIRTYLTDGTYTYNLYRDDEPIANAIADTHYTDSGLADGSYTYHVTTNYYGGETEPSNSVTVTVPGLVTQTVELAATWTWWTPVVTTTLAELEAAIGSNGILIKSQDGGFVRCENGQWSGTLQDFVPGQMYRIATQEADTFTLTGMPVTTAGISIMQGYNWFGYMGMQPADLTTALGGFTPALNDQIIGQEGAATYNGSEWTGGLTTLVPGKGYVYHSTASERKTLLIGQ